MVGKIENGSMKINYFRELNYKGQLESKKCCLKKGTK